MRAEEHGASGVCEGEIHAFYLGGLEEEGLWAELVVGVFGAGWADYHLPQTLVALFQLIEEVHVYYIKYCWRYGDDHIRHREWLRRGHPTRPTLLLPNRAAVHAGQELHQPRLAKIRNPSPHLSSSRTPTTDHTCYPNPPTCPSPCYVPASRRSSPMRSNT